jgi:hypothetical protein
MLTEALCLLLSPLWSPAGLGFRDQPYSLPLHSFCFSGHVPLEWLGVLPFLPKLRPLPSRNLVFREKRPIVSITRGSFQSDGCYRKKSKPAMGESGQGAALCWSKLRAQGTNRAKSWEMRGRVSRPGEEQR